MLLSGGGNRLSIDGWISPSHLKLSIRGMYRHFVELVKTGAGDVDLAPLKIVFGCIYVRTRVGRTKHL